MTTKSEFAAANEALMAEDRTKAGGPPTADEMLGYMRGELSAEEADRIRERLIAYPELVRTLTAPFPEGAEPGDPDYLSDHEFARHWAALQKRRPRSEGGRVLQFWRGFGAIAAMLAVVFGVMLWRAERELKTPQAVWDQQEIFSDAKRGRDEGTQTLTTVGESYLLIPQLGGDSDFERYRPEIFKADSAERLIWSGEPVKRSSQGSFVILVPRSFLSPGKYKLVVYGINGAVQQPLSTYTFRVAKP